MDDRGHRTVPHTADLRVEAWAPTRQECLAEALRGLIDSFADVTGAPAQRITERSVLAATDADMLAAAAEEIIYLLDAEGRIPVNLQVRPVTGGVVLELGLAAADAVEITGAAPKAVSFHGLRFGPDHAGRWSASMTVDV
ncbi:MAG TPA: archease [Streptosporangiaceae bacterium]